MICNLWQVFNVQTDSLTSHFTSPLIKILQVKTIEIPSQISHTNDEQCAQLVPNWYSIHHSPWLSWKVLSVLEERQFRVHFQLLKKVNRASFIKWIHRCTTHWDGMNITKLLWHTQWHTTVKDTVHSVDFKKNSCLKNRYLDSKHVIIVTAW